MVNFTITISGLVSCMEMEAGYLVQNFLCVLEDGVIAVLAPAWRKP